MPHHLFAELLKSITGIQMSPVAYRGSLPALNTWYHLVGTFDGSTARLYVNGVLVTSAAISGYSPQSINPFEIAQSEAATGKPLEADQMRWKGRRDIDLTFDRRHRILFPAEHEGRTLYA